MREPHRGEVWWTETPDLGRRPVLILQRGASIPRLHSVLAVPITRTRRGIPTELLLTVDDGLPDECAAAFDNIQPVRKSYLVQHICTLSPLRMDEACLALNAAVDC